MVVRNIRALGKLLCTKPNVPPHVCSNNLIFMEKLEITGLLGGGRGRGGRGPNIGNATAARGTISALLPHGIYEQ
jgi:hypothetical protein